MLLGSTTWFWVLALAFLASGKKPNEHYAVKYHVGKNFEFARDGSITTIGSTMELEMGKFTDGQEIPCNTLLPNPNRPKAVKPKVNGCHAKFICATGSYLCRIDKNQKVSHCNGKSIKLLPKCNRYLQPIADTADLEAYTAEPEAWTTLYIGEEKQPIPARVILPAKEEGWKPKKFRKITLADDTSMPKNQVPCEKLVDPQDKDLKAARRTICKALASCDEPGSGTDKHLILCRIAAGKMTGCNRLGDNTEALKYTESLEDCDVRFKPAPKTGGDNCDDVDMNQAEGGDVL